MFTSENLETLPQIRSTHPDMPNITFGQIGIAKLLNNINPSKAGGPDKLPARLLKETADEIAPMYTHLFTQSYKLGQLPTSWKSATICPIFKKGKRSLPENYRPVSLTAIPCKIFEHILVSQIWNHLNKYDIITSKQHGFRKGMSCETQLVEAIHDWTTILNKGQGQVDVILLDFSKAFDTVPHQRLLQKLRKYGIRNHTLNGISSFLTNRTHHVVVNGSTSNIESVLSGVLQGTVLGPLLFLIYINDIEQHLTSKIRLFADDSAIHRNINCPNDAKLLQNDIFRLQEWAATWQMKFNIKKCKILRITRRTKNAIKFQYTMSSPRSHSTITVPPEIQRAAADILITDPPTAAYTHLEDIQSDKYLGVVLDNRLSFNKHTDEISKKATNLLNLCRRNLHMCHENIKETAYKAIIRPHLEYASPSWNPYTSRNINKIEAVQRRAARFVLGNYNYSPTSGLTHDIHHRLKWIPLQHRRALYDLALFYKIRSNMININFPPIVQPSSRQPNRYLHVQALHSDAYKYNFFNSTIRTWNIIPNQALSS